MSGTVTNEIAIQWCVEARKILKRKKIDMLRTRSKYEVDLESLTSDVNKLLGALNSRQLVQAKTDLEDKLKSVGQKIHDSQEHDVVKLQAEELQALAETAEEVTKKFDEYQKLRDSAEKHRRSLQSQGADETKDAPTPPGGKLHANYKSIVDALHTADLDKGKPLAALGGALDTCCTTLEKKKIDKFAKDEEKNLKTLVSNALSDAEHKPVYEDKVRRINAAIQELEVLPGTNEQIANLRKLLVEGRKVANPGKYKEAYGKLQGLSGNLKDGHKAAETFAKSAGNQKFQTELKLAQTAVKDYDKLCGLTDPDSVKDAEDGLNTILKRLAGVTPTESQIQEAERDAKVIREELNRKAESAQQIKTACESGFSDLPALVKEIEAKAEYAVAGKIASEYRDAQSLLGLQNYQEAKNKFEKVQLDANSELLRIRPLVSTWENKKREVSEKLQEVETITQNWGDLFPALNKTRGELVTKWQLTILNPIADQKLRDYTKAASDADGILSEIATRLDPLKEKYTQIKQALNESASKRRTSLDEVEAALKTLREKGADTAALEEEKKQSLMTLELERAKVATGTDIDDRPAYLERKTQAFVDECKRIETAATGLLDPSKATELQDLVDIAKSKEADAKFAHGIRTIDAYLKYLQEEAYEGTKLDQLKTDKSNLPANDLDAVEKLIGKLQDAKGEVDKQRKEKAKTAHAKVDNCNKALKNLISAHKSHKPFLDTISEQIKTLEQSLKSSSVAAADIASQHLDELASSLTATSSGSLKDALTKVDAKFTALADATNLKSPLVKKFKGTRLKLLEKRLQKAVKPTTYAEDPRESLKEPSALLTFEKDVQQIVEQANAFQSVQTRVDQLAKNLETRLKDPTLKTILDANPKTLKSIEARIASAKTPQRNLYAGEVSLKAVDVQLNGFLQDTEGTGKDAKAGDLLLNHEAQLAKAEVEAEIKGKKFAADLAVFEKNELREATAAKERVGKRHDEQRWKDLQESYKQAKKLSGKKLLDRADESLRRAREIARDFAFNPLGPAFAARGQLLRVEKRWKFVVSKFAKAVRKLATDIENAVATDTTPPTVDPKQVAFTVKAINELSRSFDPNAFSSAAQAMSQDDVSVKDLRRHKEAALRTVRAYQARVNSDPLLAEIIIKNPFEPVTAERVKDVLTDFELNFKRA